METNNAHYTQVLAEQGAEFCGIQKGPAEAMILFADRELGTTLAVRESEFSSEEVSRRLKESRTAHELDSDVQKSLC